MLRAHFGLPTVEAEEGEGRPPIKVQFEIPYFTTSGIQVYASSSSLLPVTDVGVAPGPLSEDHREEWLPGSTLGQIHHSEWRYTPTFSADHTHKLHP